MLGLLFLLGLATATPVSNLEWNPIASQLLTARSAVPTNTVAYQQAPTTFVAAGQPSYLTAVPASRDLSGGYRQATGGYYQSLPTQNVQYQSTPTQTVQARDFTGSFPSTAVVQTGQYQSIPTQTIQARNFTGSFPSAAAVVQTPTFSQMPTASISQIPALSQTLPVARHATFTTDTFPATFPAKKTTPFEFGGRSISTNPDNIKVLGRNSTITLIHQDDDTSLLLINSTNNHAHHLHHHDFKNESLIEKVPVELEAVKLPVKNTTTSWFGINAEKKVIPTVIRHPIANQTFTQDTIVAAPVVAPLKTQSVITSSWKDVVLNNKPTADWAVIPTADSQKNVYVFDFLAPPVTSSQLLKLVEEAVPGQTYPALTTIPVTSFTCAGKATGYYADVETNCQVFHRCDTELKQSDYLCPEKTVYNQVTLICDWFFNVDCASSPKFEKYANSRLYTDLPLFDTPPKDYVPRWVGLYYNQLENERKVNDAQVRVLKF